MLLFLFSPFLRLNNLVLVLPRHAKVEQAVRRQQAQTNGQRLGRLDGARDRRAGQDDRGQQRQLDAVRLPVLDAVAAEGVLRIVSFGVFAT